jgi:hypothetical protein
MNGTLLAISRATVARRATGTGGPRDDRDDEIARLKSKVGEITMDNELLYAKIGDGGQAPFGPQEVETMSRALSPSFARCLYCCVHHASRPPYARFRPAAGAVKVYREKESERGPTGLRWRRPLERRAALADGVHDVE